MNETMLFGKPPLKKPSVFDRAGSSIAVVFSADDRVVEIPSDGRSARGLAGRSKGKVYFEMLLTLCENSGGPYQTIVGIANNQTRKDAPWYGYEEILIHRGGLIYGAFVQVAYSLTYTQGDVIGVAVDFNSSTKTIQFYRNGVPGPLLNLGTYGNVNSEYYPIVASPNTQSGTKSITRYVEVPQYLPAGFEIW